MGVKVAFQEAPSEKADSKSPERRLSIPKAALRSENGSDLVFVLKDNRASRRAIKVNGRDGDRVILLSGVAAGERVIVRGPENLSDGQNVKAVQLGAPPLQLPRTCRRFT